MKKAGITGRQATPIGLRHSFAISCLELWPQISIQQIQKWMGHKNINSTISYFKAFKPIMKIENMDVLWEQV